MFVISSSIRTLIPSYPTSLRTLIIPTPIRRVPFNPHQIITESSSTSHPESSSNFESLDDQYKGLSTFPSEHQDLSLNDPTLSGGIDPAMFGENDPTAHGEFDVTPYPRPPRIRRRASRPPSSPLHHTVPSTPSTPPPDATLSSTASSITYFERALKNLGGFQVGASDAQSPAPSKTALKRAFWLLIEAAKADLQTPHPQARRILGLCHLYGIGTRQDLAHGVSWLERASLAGDALAATQLAALYQGQVPGYAHLHDPARAFAVLSAAAPRKAPGWPVVVASTHVQVLVELARCHLAGAGCAKDARVALAYLRAASRRRSVQAMVLLAGLYDGAHGLPADPQEALRLLGEAAELGDAGAALQLGRRRLGSGEVREALRWLERAAEADSAEARLELAKVYLARPDAFDHLDRALQLLTQNCQARDAESVYLLATVYLDGQLVRRNDSRGYQLLCIGAELGHAACVAEKAQCLRAGRGVVANPTEALRCFEQAAGLGVAEAMYETGKALLPSSPEKAVAYFEQAAAQQHPQALMELGMVYYQGAGDAQRDLQKAIGYLEAAAALDDGWACMQLGLCYGNGEGVARDTAKAVELLERATASRSATILFNVGFQFSAGRAVPRNRTRALQLYKRAAKGGHPSAMYYLGCAYLQGVDISKNDAKALEMFEAAAQLGHAKSKAEAFDLKNKKQKNKINE